MPSVKPMKIICSDVGRVLTIAHHFMLLPAALALKACTKNWHRFFEFRIGVGLALAALFLVLAPVQSYSLTTNSVGLVQYTAIDNTSYVLQPWFGRNLALLTPTNQVLSANIMGPILVALDAAWDYYRSVSPAGRSPTTLSSTTLYGRDTIAVVNSTCGAGCSYVGFTGTEILPAYFNTLYNGYASSQQFDQVVFYEFGRNWWFYGGQLD